MQILKAIIFDMDGTLADTEEIHRQAFNAAFDEFNIPCHWNQELYKKLLHISGGRERISQYLTEQNLIENKTNSISNLTVNLHKRKSEIYRQRLVDGHVGLRPGVGRLIDEAIQNNIVLAIATSSSMNNVETLLKSTLGNDALKLFNTIVTADIVEEKKPSPAVFSYALEQLGLHPECCIAIEDTYNGNKAALAAGIETVITTHMFTTDDNFEGASLVVNQLGDPNNPILLQSGNTYDSEYVDLSMLNKIIASKTHPQAYKEAAAIAVE